MMSRKIVYLLAIVVFIAFSVRSFAQSDSSGRAYLSIRVAGAESSDHSVVLGQNEPAKKPGLFERMKQSFANWAKDDEDFEDEYYREPVPDKSVRHDAISPTNPVAIPTKPPKPVTATEVRDSVGRPDAPVAERRNTATNRSTPDRRTASASPPASAVKPAAPTTGATAAKTTPAPVEATATETASTETKGTPAPPEAPSEDTIFERLKSIREQVFDKQQIDESVYQDQYLETRSTRSAPTPMSSERTTESARTAQPARTDRTPPPRTRIAEPIKYSPIVTNETLVEEAPDEAPMQSRPTRNDRPASNVRSLETVHHHDVQPTRIHSFEMETEEHRHVVTTERTERTVPLSKVEVQRNANPTRTAARPQDGAAGIRSAEPLLRRSEPYETPTRRTPEKREPERVASTVIETSIPVDAAAAPAPRAPQDRSSGRGKTVLVSPRLEVETESDPRAIVGQEAVYKIRVLNRGGSAAEQVSLSVEIPDWIEIRQPEVSAGTTSIVPRSNTRDIRDFIWKISRIEANAETLLVLRLVPQQRKSMDLKIRYDFFKPSAVAKLVVQEPVLEMELEGPAEVLWGTRVGYRLLVRNVGNGDAENVQLELLQTGSDMKSCELPLLRAGEEQVIDVDVWTGKQESIDINIQATGRYDLSGKVSKKVKVMRPEVVVSIEAPAVQFVGSPAEFVVKVRNVGGAEAKDIQLAATLPLGARFDSCSAGGEITSKNQVLWKIDSIPVNDVFMALVVCEPKREGTCKLEAVAGDASGVLARCDSAFDAAAIVELKLDVDNPAGPIEVGRESIYTVHLVNRGTKAAENVETTVFFGKHLEPYAIEGGTAYTSDGQVVFDKIPTIGAGQRLTLKVKARAESAGSHRVRTEVVCGAADIHLVNEQATYFFSKEKSKAAPEVRDEPRERVAQRTTTIAAPKVQVPVKRVEAPLVVAPSEKKPSLTPPLPVIVPSVKAEPVDPFLQP